MIRSVPQRVVLTTWDPSAYFDLSGDEFILHLVAAALKSETVLLRDQDLSFNQRIAQIFIKAPLDEGRSLFHRRLLEELFDTHLFQVVCMRHDEFRSQELAEMAAEQPIRARALYVKRNNLYVSPAGEPPFDPDKEPFKSFHRWIDSVLVKRRHKPIAFEHAPSTEIPTRFRRELVLRTLQSRNNIQRGWGIAPSTLDLIGDLLPNKERALRFLRQSNVKGARRFADSPRRLLYAIAHTPALLHEESQLQRLAQSVFAAVYCDAMGAEGVYNSRLSEPPPPDTETIALPRPSEVAAFHRRELKIAPGIGEALVEARNSPAVGNFLLAPALERPMVETALDHYADVFARVYAAKRPKPEPILGNAGTLLHEKHGYLVAAFFFLGMVTIGGPNEVVELGKFALDTVITGATFAHIADRVNLWRQRRVNNALRSELRIAMDHRCHKVPLLLRKS